VADGADEIDGAGCDDEAVGWGEGAGLGKSGGEIGDGLGRDVEGLGSGGEGFERGGAGIVDGGEEDVIAMAVGIAGGGVKEWEEDLGHLLEGLVAEATEEERARLGGGELGDGSAEGPGSGGVVGYIEQEIGALGEGEEFEAAGPRGIANTRFNIGVCDFVTYLVT